MKRLAEVALLDGSGEGVPSTFSREQLRLSPRLALPPPTIDWGLVVALRRRAGEEIARRSAVWEKDHGRRLNPLDRRLLGRPVIDTTVADHVAQLGSTGEALWDLETERAYAAAVEDAVFGYGRLQPLFEVPDAENVELHGCDSVVVQYSDGRRVDHPPVADTDEELVEAIRFLGESAVPSRPFDDAHPTMTLALGERFRLHAIGFGLSYRPSVTIRQHLLTEVTLNDLVRSQMLTPELGRFLHAAVLARKSMVISGGQGAGKTTLLRALISAIPAGERFGTLETDYELLSHLQPARKGILALQARAGMGETQHGRRVGEYTVADLIPEALRQNLTRLIVGEVRGGEAGAMFEAMVTGAGTLSTTHSHSAASTIDRLASRVAQGGFLTIEQAYRQIAHHLHFVVHVQLLDDTWRHGTRTRRVTEVLQLTGGVEAGRPVTHVVYRSGPHGAGSVTPEPDVAAEFAQYAAAWES